MRFLKAERTNKHKQRLRWEDAVEFPEDFGFFDVMEPPKDPAPTKHKPNNKPETKPWEGQLRHHKPWKHKALKCVVSHLTAAAECFASRSTVTNAHHLNTGFNVNNLQHCKVDNPPDLTALVAKPTTIESTIESVFKMPDIHALKIKAKRN